MRVDKKRFIYLISPNKIKKSFYTNLKIVLSSNLVSFFQLRLKKYSLIEKKKIGIKVKKICKKYKVKLIINDDPNLAKKIGADGCHLGQNDVVIQVARKILSQNSMKPFAGKEIGPGDNANSDEEIEEYIRSKAETAYHPSCTLKMGIDDMAVVDEKLKIHGLQNIRVADASVMPEITSGNLNAPTLMIGERAADFILN